MTIPEAFTIAREAAASLELNPLAGAAHQVSLLRKDVLKILANLEAAITTESAQLQARIAELEAGADYVRPAGGVND